MLLQGFKGDEGLLPQIYISDFMQDQPRLINP